MLTKTKDDENIILEDNAVSYLQMTQSNIERMSTSSAIFKGFSATIVSGITAISFSDINIWVLIMSFVPVLCFFALDIYYLGLEKRFRKLYQNILDRKQPINFDMNVKKLKKRKTNPNGVSVFETLKSPSILLFYPMLVAILFVVVILKVKGVL